MTTAVAEEWAALECKWARRESGWVAGQYVLMHHLSDKELDRLIELRRQFGYWFKEDNRAKALV